MIDEQVESNGYPSPQILPLVTSHSSHSILLIFVDGLGIGTRGAHNPLDGLDGNLLALFQGEAPSLPYGGKMVSTDATLGVEGLPRARRGRPLS